MLDSQPMKLSQNLTLEREIAGGELEQPRPERVS